MKTKKHSKTKTKLQGYKNVRNATTAAEWEDFDEEFVFESLQTKKQSKKKYDE
jgi:hypothetical protein